MRPAALNAKVNQARFLLAGYDLNIGTKRSRGSCDELLLVAGIANGRGRDSADGVYLQPLVLLCHAAQHAADQVHRFLADAARAEHAGSQTRYLPLRSQDARRLSGRDLSRFHPNRVAANIDRGVARHTFAMIPGECFEGLTAIITTSALPRMDSLFTPNRHRGKLIIVEGIDGSGKSTQISLLSRWLRSSGFAVAFSEWNSSPLVRETTRRGKKKEMFTPTTFSLIHATDFADRTERYILPLVRAGAIVCADRYAYTAFARDVARGVDPQWVRNLYSFAIRPNIAFYFKTPLEVALSRILGGRDALKYYEAGMDLGISSDVEESFRVFQGRILAEYEAMTAEMGFHVIDATQSIEDQQRQMRDVVKKVLGRSLKTSVLRAPAPFVAGEVKSNGEH